MSLRAAAASLLLAISLAAPARSAGPPSRTGGEGVVEFLTIWLDLERKGLAEDLEDFERSTARLVRAEADLTTAAQKLGKMGREGTGDRQAVSNLEDAVAEAEGRVRTEQERRRTLSARLGERVRRISSLREEVLRRREAGRSAEDPLSGRWEVTINPGPRRAVFRLVLDGTLVWGDYTMDGDFRGSFRGTLVGDKLFLERIDSERGIDARFWGRVMPAQKRISGTWEATAMAPSVGPIAGSWTAVPAKDEEGD